MLEHSTRKVGPRDPYYLDLPIIKGLSRRLTAAGGPGKASNNLNVVENVFSVLRRYVSANN